MMKKQLAVGFIPYEIGDTIVLRNSILELVIEDIRMIQYIRDGRAEFEVSLEGTWFSSELIERRIIRRETV